MTFLVLIKTQLKTSKTLEAIEENEKKLKPF